MKNANVKSAPVAPAKAEAKPEQTAPTKAEPKPVVIKVLKKDAKYRGARDAWYKVLIAHDGKTLKEFEDAVKEKHPSTPQKGHLAGKLEPPSGWVSFFKRTGIIELTESK